MTQTDAPRLRMPDGLPLLLGMAITLALRGYQFGSGNHCVYLIEPLRRVHPELLANDWWTTHTLQYHVAFIKLTAWLMRLGIVEPTFLFLYLLLVVLLHIAWLRLVRTLGLDARAYLLSVILYYLSAGGTGLGSYQFLQDSSFLPGNVANVAMLWGIVCWIQRRMLPAAITLAIASLFHLNHAIVALALWPIASLYARRRGTMRLKTALVGLATILLLSLPNLIPAARAALTQAPRMPLAQFVNLYVHLRHPHHYDPLSWPIALWISFLWPIPLATAWWRSGQTEARSRAAFVCLFFMTLLMVALLFAGMVFISEPLIQMSLFRFSIYPKLITCMGAAGWLVQPKVSQRRAVRALFLAAPIALLIAIVSLSATPPATKPMSTVIAFVKMNLVALLLFGALILAAMTCLLHLPNHFRRLLAVLCISATLAVAWQGRLGLRIALDDDDGPAYLELCRWARAHTPVDALFVVPPNEQLFRFHARRAIVVNFKNVPQLSTELPEWRQRLETVLDEPLTTLPQRFDLAHAAIAARYDSLPAAHLAAVARRYGARYIVTTHPLDDHNTNLRLAFENKSYHLYDLAHE